MIKNFDEILERIKKGIHESSKHFDGNYLEIKTQVQLAEILEVYQSTISYSQKRGSVPDAWLMTLLRKFNLNPEWIMTGDGDMFLVPCSGNDSVNEDSSQ